MPFALFAKHALFSLAILIRRELERASEIQFLRRQFERLSWRPSGHRRALSCWRCAVVHSRATRRWRYLHRFSPWLRLRFWLSQTEKMLHAIEIGIGHFLAGLSDCDVVAV